MPSSRSRLHANWAESIENWGIVVSEQVRHQPPQDSYKLGGEKTSVESFFCPVIKSGFRWNCALSPPLHVPGLSNLEFCYQLIIHRSNQIKQSKSHQQLGKLASKCCIIAYFHNSAQLVTTAPSRRLSIFRHMSFTFYDIAKKRKIKLFYAINVMHIMSSTNILNSAQLATTAPSIVVVNCKAPVIRI